MTEVCEKCGREPPSVDSSDYTPWEADVHEDGSVGVICPACLARMVEEAIDEGEIWTEIEQLPPQDLEA